MTEHRFDWLNLEKQYVPKPKSEEASLLGRQQFEPAIFDGTPNGLTDAICTRAVQYLPIKTEIMPGQELGQILLWLKQRLQRLSREYIDMHPEVMETKTFNPELLLKEFITKTHEEAHQIATSQGLDSPTDDVFHPNKAYVDHSRLNALFEKMDNVKLRD